MRRSRRAGFGLVEAMIVVVIIGIVMATIAPQISIVVADGRMKTATQEVMRLGRRARWKALVTGTPHSVLLAGSGTQFGVATLYKGMGARCDHTDWNQASARALAVTEQFDLGVVNPGAASTGDEGFRISMRPTSGGVAVASVWICHQPNGESYVGIPAGDGSVTLQRQRTDVAVLISVLNEENDRWEGDRLNDDRRRRRIVFSPGQMPWYAPWLQD